MLSSGNFSIDAQPGQQGVLEEDTEPRCASVVTQELRVALVVRSPPASAGSGNPLDKCHQVGQDLNGRSLHLWVRTKPGRPGKVD